MSTLKIATFNANSIRTRLEQILAWLEREQPDVLAVQETKVQDADFPAEAIQAAGYHVAYRGQKAHAGVALLSRAEPEQVIFGFDEDEDKDEARLIRATVQGVQIINSYVPQGRATDDPMFSYKLAWFARVRTLLTTHYRTDDLLVWLGDLNVAPEERDLHNPKGNLNNVDFHPDARAALAQTMSWGLEDVFRRHHPDKDGQYTYWDYRVPKALERNLGWRIDHILATPALARRSTACWIDVTARAAERPSDHTFLTATFEL